MKNLKSFVQLCNKSLINQACSGPYWENICPRSFLYGPRCAWSVLSRPWADILPVWSSCLVNKIYLSVWRDEGALCVECLAVFVPSLPHPLLSNVYQCDECLSSQGCGGSWLGCQVLPASIAVSILELAANSGSSRMSRAPNLHIAPQLFT